ncbi:MAG: PatB family C-S lyase [Clostridia bacterium]|nr:PatB family C-S lyase [Clostridia bacterium]
MKYDFTSIPDRRNCGSNKWNGAKNASPEFVPLSVADMEFYPAPQIVEAIKKTAETQVLGYTSPTGEYFDAVISWMKRRHDFDVKKEWIINTPGVVDALAILIQASTKPGDGVIILTPVYYPFDMAVLAKSRKIVYSELIEKDGRYEIDYADLEKKCKNASALLFCNPHNPVGRVWSEDELKKVAEICCRNDVFIIDDEIHHDLIMPGYEHTVMAKVGDFVLDNIAVCTAPSKTFNLAGLQCSNIIIPDSKMRAKATACSLFNMQMGLNIFAYPACIAAYNECEDWLEELLDVVHENAVLVENFMAENFPEIRVYPLEGTYLQWLDMRKLGMTHVELRRMLEKAGLYLDNGEMFGPLGRGFQRINLACAKITIEKALERFKKAVEEVRADWEENGKPYHKTLAVGEKLENFVYASPKGTHQTLSGKTFIVFSRFYECELCRVLLASFSAAYPVFKAMGYDIKFVMQSDISTLAKNQKKYPFELIADPECKLYDMYNVFEADGIVNMLAGDKLIEFVIGKNVYKMLNLDMIESVNSALAPAEETDGPRENQLCAFVAVDKNMNITYAHYSKTMTDFPDVKDIIKILGK